MVDGRYDHLTKPHTIKLSIYEVLATMAANIVIKYYDIWIDRYYTTVGVL